MLWRNSHVRSCLCRGTASKIGGVFAVRCWRDGTALDRVDEPPTRLAGGS